MTETVCSGFKCKACLRTSGAAYDSVKQGVCSRPFFLFLSVLSDECKFKSVFGSGLRRAKPKSTILILALSVVSEKSMFSGLRSRCTTPFNKENIIFKLKKLVKNRKIHGIFQILIFTLGLEDLGRKIGF